MKKAKILWLKKHTGMIRADHARVVEPIEAFCTDQVTASFEDEQVGYGAYSTLIHVCTDVDPFSFLLRDVNTTNPIYLPRFGVIVTAAEDSRSYEEIETAILSKGRKTKMQQIDSEEEYSYEKAAKETRDLPGPAWLGVSKDMRFFEVGMRSKSCGNDEETYDYVRPRFFDSIEMRNLDPDIWTEKLLIPEMNDTEEYKFSMVTGRGIGCKHEVTKRLEDGYLPILNAQNLDEGIRYSMQYFATLEYSAFTAENLRGTDMYVAHAFACGHNFWDKKEEHAKAILEDEIFREEETVMYVRITAENMTDAPAYSFVLLPSPIPGWDWSKPVPDIRYDGQSGYLYSGKTGKIMCICTLEGEPVPQEEMAVLLAPGEKIVYEYKIPHRPITPERAAALKDCSYDSRLAEAKCFWKNELKNTADIRLPEKRIEEMIKAGMLHIDIGYFGKNPDSAVIPIVGIYAGIGSESSPGIQFLDTMGKHDLAARAIDYFIELQRSDGAMQVHGGYMLETGCVLWTMSEHFRMTRDTQWLASVKESIIRGAQFLVDWRERELSNDLKGGNGYGMVSGRVSDPLDFYHSFMLNACSYVGLSRAAEMLCDLDPAYAQKFSAIAAELKDNIRESYQTNLAKSPVLPAADGSWYQAAAPWTEYAGPVTLYNDGGKWFTHGAFTGRDVEGAAYLLLHGVIGMDEPWSEEIIKYYTELLMINNTGFSQSYYSPHPFIHAHRGEVKPFLKEFYSGFVSLADREIYSFWEHYFHASQHKLHEETWFLMRCRWMLCLEKYEKRELKLFAAAPRRWFADGEVIEVDGLCTYYGKVSYKAESGLSENRIRFEFKIDGSNHPAVKKLTVRLPHPQEKKAKYATAGVYDAQSETVTLEYTGDPVSFELVF